MAQLVAACTELGVDRIVQCRELGVGRACGLRGRPGGFRRCPLCAWLGRALRRAGRRRRRRRLGLFGQRRRMRRPGSRRRLGGDLRRPRRRGLGHHWRLLPKMALARTQEVQDIGPFWFAFPLLHVFRIDAAAGIDVRTAPHQHVFGRHHVHGRCFAGIRPRDPYMHGYVVHHPPVLCRKRPIEQQEERGAPVVVGCVSRVTYYIHPCVA